MSDKKRRGNVYREPSAEGVGNTKPTGERPVGYEAKASQYRNDKNKSGAITEIKKRRAAPKLPKDYTHNSKGVETGFSDEQKKELFNPFVDDENEYDETGEHVVKYASGDDLELNSYDADNPYLASDEDLEEEVKAQREYALAQKKQTSMPSIRDKKKQSVKKRKPAPDVPVIPKTVEDDSRNHDNKDFLDSEVKGTDDSSYEEEDFDSIFNEEDDSDREEESAVENDSFDDPDVNTDEEDPFSEISDEELFGDIDNAIEEGVLLDDPFVDTTEDLFDNESSLWEDNSEYVDGDSEFEEDEDDEIKFGQSVFDGFDVNAILADAIDEDASDVYITANKGVWFKLLGEMKRCTNYPIPDGRVTKAVQEYIATNMADQDFIRDKELDTSYIIKHDPLKRDAGIEQRHVGRRLRVNMAWEFDDVYIVFRVIKDKIPAPEDLGIPDDLIKWLDAPAGLVLINGSTGTGKTTTLASMLRTKQLTRPETIITIERPVEFVYPNDGKALVLQREVGRDTHSFSNALTSAMRQSPDTILIGEVRNKEEVDALLVAADTGHLAISTMHTNSVAITLNRIKSMFEGEEQQHVLHQLADALQGIANQVLLKTPDGKGRFAVREVLAMNDEIRPLIAAGDVEGVRDYQREHKITMEHLLADAVHKGKCTLEAGRYKAVNAYEFDRYLKALLEESPGDVVRDSDMVREV